MEKDEVMREAFEETIEPDQLDRHLPVDEYKNLMFIIAFLGLRYRNIQIHITLSATQYPAKIISPS